MGPKAVGKAPEPCSTGRIAPRTHGATASHPAVATWIERTRRIAPRTHGATPKRHAGAQGALGGAVCMTLRAPGSCRATGAHTRADQNEYPTRHHTQHVKGQETSQSTPQERQEAEVGPLRAQVLKLHVAHGLEADTRRDAQRKVDTMLPGRRLAVCHRIRRV